MDRKEKHRLEMLEVAVRVLMQVAIDSGSVDEKRLKLMLLQSGYYESESKV